MSPSSPVIIVATDLRPGEAAWDRLAFQADELAASTARLTGLSPVVGLACLPTPAGNGPAEWIPSRVIARLADQGAGEVFVLPTPFEMNVWQRTLLGEDLVEARRRYPAVSINHDAVDPAYPLLVDCFAGRALTGLSEMGVSPSDAGLLLVADGRGDPGTRADSFRLMRLLWEQTGVARGEVGFVRHTAPFLPVALERCLRDPLDWVLIPQCQWDGDLCDRARVLLADHQRARPEAVGWPLMDPPGDHPAILGWLEQRMRRLWQEKRARQASRIPSKKRQSSTPTAEVWSGEAWTPLAAATRPSATGCLARASGRAPLAEFLGRVLPRSERCLVKVTWHGYATGTYTSAAVLDQLLGALGGQVTILEGHTSGRNTGGLDIDWDRDTDRHRAWIRQQELDYLRRTGLAEVLARHRAQYVNVTEAWWDGACASKDDVMAWLGGAPLRHPELAGFVPAALAELRGTPMISLARLKGPTRLSVSNLFGLIPHPLRTPWHGTDTRFFASVCCDLARIYGSLFPLFGLVEAFESAVRWDRKGIYRSRWGNYDLIATDGLFTFSDGLVGADILASRLQGQDIRRSAFYDMVRDRLGWPQPVLDLPLPDELRLTFA